MDVELGNSLVRFSIEVWTTVCQFPIFRLMDFISLFSENTQKTWVLSSGKKIV